MEHIFHQSDLSAHAFLVTGGSGFIGSNIVDYLMKHGAGKVRVLDNFLIGNKSNIENYLSNPSFELIEGDIRDLETCMEACQGIDFVTHQAALGSVPRSIESPEKTNAINVDGFLNMAIAASKNQVKRFVYASSSSVYGDSPVLPKKNMKSDVSFHLMLFQNIQMNSMPMYMLIFTGWKYAAYATLTFSAQSKTQQGLMQL